MSNVYQVNIEGNVSEVTTLAEVKSLLGDTKVTKKAIESGDYPMVTIATAPTLDLEDATEEVEVATANTEDVATTEEPTDEVDEDTTEEVDEDTTDEVDEDTTDEVDEDTTDEVDEDTTDEVDEDTTEEESTDEVLDLTGYVPGATAMLSDDSQNEEFIEWLFEANLPNDEVVILSVDERGNVEVKGYEGTLSYEDLKVVAPPKVKGKPAKLDVNPERDGYPVVGHFKEEGDIKKYIKKLADEQLEEWCLEAGATWNQHDNPSINRMRMAMAIKAKHFTHLSAGNGKSKGGKKSKYADYTNGQLAQMAIDNDVEVRDAKGDDRIERMYLIMDLRKAGVIE